MKNKYISKNLQRSSDLRVFQCYKLQNETQIIKKNTEKQKSKCISNHCHEGAALFLVILSSHSLSLYRCRWCIKQN